MFITFVKLPGNPVKPIRNTLWPTGIIKIFIFSDNGNVAVVKRVSKKIQPLFFYVSDTSMGSHCR